MVCVKAHGREDQHKAKKEKNEDGVIEVAMGYCRVGAKKLLVGKEKKTGHIFSHLVQCKGGGGRAHREQRHREYK